MEIQLLGHLLELGDIEGRTDISQHSQGGIIHQHDSEQGQGDADGTEDQVFPAGLQRFAPPPEGDEKRRRQGRGFDRDPLHPQTVRDGRHDHGQDEHMKQKEEKIEALGRDDASGHLLVHVGAHVQRTGQADGPDNKQNHRREGVDVHDLAERRDRALRQDRSRDRRFCGDQDPDAGQIREMEPARAGEEETESPGHQRCEQEQTDCDRRKIPHHSFSSLRRLVSTLSNASCSRFV